MSVDRDYSLNGELRVKLRRRVCGLANYIKDKLSLLSQQDMASNGLTLRETYIRRMHAMAIAVMIICTISIDEYSTEILESHTKASHGSHHVSFSLQRVYAQSDTTQEPESDDAHLPVVTIRSPEDGSKLTSGIVNVTGKTLLSSNGKSIDHVEVSIDNDPDTYKLATPKSPDDWSRWSLLYNIPIGDHTLTARVTDSDGKQNWNTITVSRPSYIRKVTILLDEPVKANSTDAYTTIIPKELLVGNMGDIVTADDIKVLVNGEERSHKGSIDEDGAFKFTIPLVSGDKKIEIALPVLYDDFSGSKYDLDIGQISPNGKWRDVYIGSGSAGISVDSNKEKTFHQNPGTVSSLSESHASLAISTRQLADFSGSIDFRTDEQLRKNDPPNPWEVAWVFLKYVDETHHYYFNIQENGWTFGKKDNLPGDSTVERQIYLQKGQDPSLELGRTYRLNWSIVGNHIVIFLDGNKIVDFIDDGSVGSVDEGTLSQNKDTNGQTVLLAGPGSIGMYTENAEASFDNVEMNRMG